MSTTNLFVELIVIGIGAAIWVVLAALAVFGYSWVPLDQVFSTFAAAPFLGVVYVLGIILDRVADAVFEWMWSDDLRGSYFKSRKQYYDARRIIFTKSERLSDLLEYGRSRLRICRGWAFNSILIVLSLNAFLWIQLRENGNTLSISIFGSCVLVLLSFGAWYSWRKLLRNEYRKIMEQSVYLGDHDES